MIYVDLESKNTPPIIDKIKLDFWLLFIGWPSIDNQVH